MDIKENRPDACTASGTAHTICGNDTTGTRSGQGLITLSDVVDEYISLDEFADYCREQRVTYDDVLRDSALMYLSEIDRDDLPPQGELKHGLVAAANRCIEAYNLGPRDELAPLGASLKDAFPSQKPASERYKRLSGLHPLQIALLLRELHHAKGVLWKDAGNDGNFDIGVYQTEGFNEGTYDTSRDSLARLIRSYDNAITMRGVDETEALLRAICPLVEQNANPDLVAVNNGVYDYGKKFLFAFDPEFVFTSKAHVDFVEGAPNPVIHNDEDGTDWDVVSWMSELSDDPSVVDLLWQVVGAVIRPGVSWNKSAWFYSTSGNNGKGTLCSLMRNLCGRGSWESISLKDFSNPFMLEPLMRISAVITDENDTGTFVDDAAALKSIITGDPFQLNRKFKEPRTVLFKGFMVQCVNELPRLRDRSESMYRRLLVVPFEKRFEGNERKYIKDDYLKRREVLEYVLYHILAETNYYELDEPQACVTLLDEFREVNDPVRQFLSDVLEEASWDVLSWQFIHDLYRHWFQRNIPSGRPESRKALIADIKRLLPEWSAEWSYTDNPVNVSDKMRSEPEWLISKYEMTEWMNKGYRSPDTGRVCTPDLPDRMRGLVRIAPVGSAGNDKSDSENKED